MPILPDTKVEVTADNSYVSFSYHDGGSMRLDGRGTYRYYPLGKKSEEYTVSIPAPNDWYYSKLYSVIGDTNSTIASLHLLSPQKEADTEGPLISYGDVIRVPVYQKRSLNLQSYIEDISAVDNVWVDADLTKDTDSDGDTTNDRDSLDIATSYGIKKGNTLYDLDIGPFDTLFTKKIRLFAEDGNGNISSKDLTITVYSPVPEIQSLSGTIVSGDLDEVLGDEPVDIYRLRNGSFVRIEPASGDSDKTAQDGTFHLTAKNASGIILTQSGKTIARIDERTGKIVLEDSSFEIGVTGASKNSPMLLQVLSSGKKSVFSEKIDMSAVSNIESVSDFDQAAGTGIFILPGNGSFFMKNTVSSPNLPGGGYITDADHKAIAGISK